MAATESHIYNDIFDYVDTATKEYFTDGAASVASSFHDTAYILLAVYIMLIGWSMICGLISEPVTDTTARIIKASFIITFATNSAIYAGDVASFLYDWPTALTRILNGSKITNTTQLIDQIYGKGLDLASQAWQTASLANLGSYLVALILFVMTSVITAITAVIIISSKFGLALLLALGPIFILSLLFDSTRKFFDMWLGVSVSSGFTIVLAGMSASLMFKYYEAAFDAASSNAAANAGIVSLGDIAAPTVIGIIAMFFISKVPSLAAGLSGGVSIASADAAGWAYDKIKGPTKQAVKATGKTGYNAGKSAFNARKALYGKSQRLDNSIQSTAPAASARRISNNH